MDLDKVNEIATIPVLEKAYDDLVHPSAESIGKTVSRGSTDCCHLAFLVESLGC